MKPILFPRFLAGWSPLGILEKGSSRVPLGKAMAGYFHAVPFGTAEPIPAGAPAHIHVGTDCVGTGLCPVQGGAEPRLPYAPFPRWLAQGSVETLL